MYLVRLPFFVRWLYPHSIWRVNTNKKIAYLTFDDGPIPGVTPWVLELLRKENIKATFFCVGENVHKHPGVFQQLHKHGHRVGNHTYNHVQGFKTDNEAYLKNINKAEAVIASNLFRPPHGQMKLSMSRLLRKRFKLVFWDILSCDFDKNKTGEQCFRIVKKRVRPGSVIVFHDSLKAEENLKYALPKTIAYLKAQGYTFDVID